MEVPESHFYTGGEKESQIKGVPRKEEAAPCKNHMYILVYLSKYVKKIMTTVFEPCLQHYIVAINEMK